MKLSLVIPAYNEEKYVGHSLDAIFKAIGDRNDIEVVVVNNNSADKTREVAARYAKAIIVDEARKGTNSARQAGFEKSHGELVGFLDADTMLAREWIERAENEFRKNPNLVCLSGPFIYYDLPKGINVLVKIFYGIAYFVSFVNRLIFKKMSFVQGGNYVVRRTALEQIGGHDVNITFYGDDTNLALRLNKVGEVKFSFGFPVKASGRRFVTEGVAKTAIHYAINYFWMVLFQRPFTKTSIVARPEQKGGKLRFETKTKKSDWLAAFFALIVLLAIILGIAYGVYRAVESGVFQLLKLTVREKTQELRGDVKSASKIIRSQINGADQ
jgi:glycosyltransferase involved in cell wall biosynthesis